MLSVLVVLVIIGILLAIAVPSYLGFKDRANKTAAKANVGAAIPAVEAFYSDNGTYVGATVVKLKASYDAGIFLATIMSASSSQYCAQATSGNMTAHRTGRAPHRSRSFFSRVFEAAFLGTQGRSRRCNLRPCFGVLAA